MCYKGTRHHQHTSNVPASQLLSCCHCPPYALYGKMAALKSLNVHHPETLGIWQFALRSPACMLTELTISRSHVADKDLVQIFALPARTLKRVVLDRIEGITNNGLCVFLLTISQNVAYLTAQHFAFPPFRQWGNLIIRRAERALYVVVDKLPRLRKLRISGAVPVASEFMLDRRSKMFVNRPRLFTSEQTWVSVVRLWLENVPRLCGFTADGKWLGWCTGSIALMYCSQRVTGKGF